MLWELWLLSDTTVALICFWSVGLWWCFLVWFGFFSVALSGYLELWTVKQVPSWYLQKSFTNFWELVLLIKNTFLLSSSLSLHHMKNDLSVLAAAGGMAEVACFWLCFGARPTLSPHSGWRAAPARTSAQLCGTTQHQACKVTEPIADFICTSTMCAIYVYIHTLYT